MKKVAEQQVQTKAEPEAQSVDQQAKDAEQEAPPSIPYVHTYQFWPSIDGPYSLSHGDEAEKPLVASAVASSSKGTKLEA